MSREETRCCGGGATGDGSPVRVLLIAEVRLYRDGLAAALSDDARFELVGSAPTAIAAVDLAGLSAPDVVVVDPGEEPGRALRLVAEEFPDARVLVVAVRDVEADVLALVEEGAAGFVTRDESLGELAAAVESVARGEALCSPRMAGALVRRVTALARDGSSRRPAAPLTPREREVARLLELGRSNKQIATELCIELATVKNHVHNVLDKLDVRRRSEIPARLRRVEI